MGELRFDLAIFELLRQRLFPYPAKDVVDERLAAQKVFARYVNFFDSQQLVSLNGIKNKRKFGLNHHNRTTVNVCEKRNGLM
jgi:hypothetical protein